MLQRKLTWFRAGLCAPDRITGIIALDPVMLDWVAMLAGGSGADQRVRRPTVAGCWLIMEIQSFPELPHEQKILSCNHCKYNFHDNLSYLIGITPCVLDAPCAHDLLFMLVNHFLRAVLMSILHFSLLTMDVGVHLSKCVCG